MSEPLSGKITIRLPAAFRSQLGGAGQILVDATNVAQALAALADSAPELGQRILGDDGGLLPTVTLYLGTDDIRYGQGLLTPLRAGAVVDIVCLASDGASSRERRIARLRTVIAEYSPIEARRRQMAGAVLIDVREKDEVARGSPTGAIRLNRGFLELRIEAIVADYEQPIMTLCSNGIASLFAADSLLRMGYRQVAAVAGGFAGWKEDGLPYEFPRLMNGEERRGSKRQQQDLERYGEHLAIPEIGAAGQEKLLASKVLLIGLGGLGCPAALYLAAAGVGTLGIVDEARVARRNLQREILHTDRRTGQMKVDSARASLSALNPGIQINSYAEPLSAANVTALVADYDLVIDCSSAFAASHLLNESCVRHGIPNVHGAVDKFAGQLTVFWPKYAGRPGPCYRCLYPDTPPSGPETGVMGFVPGLIGLLEAVEAIKLLLGLGDPLVGRLLRYDALDGRFVERAVYRDPACRCCGTAAATPSTGTLSASATPSNG